MSDGQSEYAVDCAECGGYEHIRQDGVLLEGHTAGCPRNDFDTAVVIYRSDPQ